MAETSVGAAKQAISCAKRERYRAGNTSSVAKQAIGRMVSAWFVT